MEPENPYQSPKAPRFGDGAELSDASYSPAKCPSCDAEITFRVLAFPEPSMRKAMEEWATRIAFPTQALADG